jgi:uncharacterized SAM-binding protein YcdF (DUF218 family)
MRAAALRLPAGVVAVVVLSLAGADLVHRWASRRGLGRPGPLPGAGPEVVLVLGFPSRRSGRPHPMQRWRTEIAVRSLRTPDGRLVFSGAGRHGRPSEAEVMAGLARDRHGIAAGRITLETRARSTWENIASSLPELEAAGTIRIASSPVHAARARRYLARQRPDLAARLAPADDHRFGERIGWKLATALDALARETYLWLRPDDPRAPSR